MIVGWDLTRQPGDPHQESGANKNERREMQVS